MRKNATLFFSTSSNSIEEAFVFAFGRCPRVGFLEPPVRNLVFPVRRCSELEIWRGPARSTLQFSKTKRRSIEVENRLGSRVLGGFGSRRLGNPHALVPARASARRLGRHHFGVGTWGLRRRSLRKPRESPRPRGRRLTASRTRTWGSGGRNSPNALALIRFGHQIP